MRKTITLSLLMVVVLLTALAATPVFDGNHGEGPGRAGDVVPDSYIVVLQDGVSADQVAKDHRVAKRHTYTAVFNGFSGKVPPGQVKKLQEDPRVVSVSANRVVRADRPGGPNKPPRVRITEPEDGATFASGATIDFAGTASDREDGDLTGSLAWTSDIDAEMSNGGSQSASLSDGNHTITASVTDGGGKTGSDSITITVGGGETPPPDDPPPPETTQVVPSGVERIGAAPWDNLSHSGAGVGVAIVDTGIDSNGDLNVGAACFNAFVAAPFNCPSDGQDDEGHGTHVAGTVAALDNTMDVVGVAPDATVYAVKVLNEQGSGSWGGVVAGLDWVLMNGNSFTPPIRVVNMSLGSPKFVDDDFIGTAIQSLHAAGISVVVSAGNNPFDEVEDRVPARFPWVMAIASTTAQDGVNTAKGSCGNISPIKTDTASSFTTDGELVGGVGVTISAPGEQREDIVKGCFISSSGILSLDLGGGTTRGSGTSMSSPHVAGVVALMVEKDGGNLDPEAARSAIRDSAYQAGTAPLNSPTGAYTYDQEREGVLNAAGALGLVP